MRICVNEMNTIVIICLRLVDFTLQSDITLSSASLTSPQIPIGVHMTACRVVVVCISMYSPANMQKLFLESFIHELGMAVL